MLYFVFRLHFRVYITTIWRFISIHNLRCVCFPSMGCSIFHILRFTKVLAHGGCVCVCVCDFKNSNNSPKNRMNWQRNGRIMSVWTAICLPLSMNYLKRPPREWAHSFVESCLCGAVYIIFFLRACNATENATHLHPAYENCVHVIYAICKMGFGTMTKTFISLG